ncbi:MAG: CBS domain-containing protein [Candidatus Omnitrophica bacterium]|nr:CBS domain-containing protein [Candidatus Omnitrophota bacterium]
MKVRDIMSHHPACCSPLTNLKEAARLMLETNCRAVVVVENILDLRPVGIITDHDIVCRCLALGLDPLEAKAVEFMTRPCITVNAETGLDDCYRILIQNSIRQMPVVDEQRSCCGMVTHADFALYQSLPL